MQRQFRVLVIDDESEMLEMLEMLLIAEGFEVITAQDALSGLRAAYQAHPDAILLSWAMMTPLSMMQPSPISVFVSITTPALM